MPIHHTLYTAGYGGIGVDDLAAWVEKHNALLVDIRHRPFATKRPEFTQNALRHRFGASYVWLQTAGNVNHGNAGPVEIMDIDAAEDVLRRLLLNRPVVLMCACGDLNACHRKVVADAMAARIGVTVSHLTLVQLRRTKSDWSRASLM